MEIKKIKIKKNKKVKASFQSGFVFFVFFSFYLPLHTVLQVQRWKKTYQ